MKILNLIKFITINLLLAIMFLFLIDFLVYFKHKNSYIIKHSKYLEIYPPISYIDNYKADYSPQSLTSQIKNNISNCLRYEYNEKYKDKKSIIVFGCSFAYGYGLENNQTFSSKLSTLTQRNVFNFAIPACGIQHMLSLLENSNIYRKIKQKPEYAIYIYIPNHLLRLNQNIYPNPIMANGINLQYELKNDSLKLKVSPFNSFSKTFIIKSIYYEFDTHKDNNTLANRYNNFILANEIFLQSKRILEKKYPDIKFIILKYEVEGNYNKEIEMPFMWDVLEKEGFIIINSSDLLKREFKFFSKDTTSDDYHPSAAAWELLCPKLIQKLNL